MKRDFLFLTMLLLLLYPLDCFAEENNPGKDAIEALSEGIKEEYIDSGYTETGIYYEVYGETISFRASEYVTVSRTVVYDGVIKPDSTIFWEELISGELYTGTLTLLRYQYTSGKTIAEYAGKLYRN